MLSRALLVWLALAVLAVLNGGLRETILLPRFGDAGARALSTLSLSVIILIVASLTIGWITPRPEADAWRIGGLWLVLTLAFEFLAGHYLFKVPWQRILADYNVLDGRIWLVVLIVTFVAPAVAAALRGRAI